MSDKFWYGLCEGLIGPEYLENLGDKKEKVLDNVVDFVRKQLASLPTQLRIALWVGLFAFKFFVFAVAFKPLYVLQISKRKYIIESWASGNIRLARQLFRPLRSLTLLAFFEQPEVSSLLIEKA